MTNSYKKVLIVDDEKDILNILKQSFVDEGFSVISAQDGEEGLKMIEEEKPDLILLDIVMPKMDGVTMAKKLKEKGIKSKILFLTNLRGKLPVAEGIIEETDYISKTDMHIDQIIAKVKEKLDIE